MVRVSQNYAKMPGFHYGETLKNLRELPPASGVGVSHSVKGDELEVHSNRDTYCWRYGNAQRIAGKSCCSWQ